MNHFMLWLSARPRRQALAYGAMTGLVLGLSRLPYFTWWLVFVAFLPLLHWLDDAPHRTRVILWAGLGFSTAFTLTALHWIGLVTMPGLFGVILLFTLYFWGLLYLQLRVQFFRPTWRYASFTILWLGWEFFLHYTELAFPYYHVAYALADRLPFVQLAELGGVYLPGLLILVINLLLYRALIMPKKRYYYYVIGILALWWLGGWVRLQTIKLTEQPHTNIAVIQGSIPQEDKWRRSMADSTLAIYQDLSNKAAVQGANLVIWPESAVPAYLLRQRRPDYQLSISKMCQIDRVNLLTGFPHFEYDPSAHEGRRWYNSAIACDTAGVWAAEPYYKQILVPVGERTPFLGLFPLLWALQFGQANFDYGTKTVLYDYRGFKYAPSICYELAFDRLSREMCGAGADFLVNVTNDAWYKKSVGTHQNAVMSVYRAVETRRMLFRSANTGISMAVLPSGKIAGQTALYERTWLSSPLYTMNNSGLTPYCRFGYLTGPLVAALAVLLSLFGLVQSKKKRLTYLSGKRNV